MFRENRISGDPTLPFNSLAMPGYADLTAEGLSDETAGTVIIESNHFRCQCDSVAWLIAAMEHDYQKVIQPLSTTGCVVITNKQLPAAELQILRHSNKYFIIYLKLK